MLHLFHEPGLWRPRNVISPRWNRWKRQGGCMIEQDRATLSFQRSVLEIRFMSNSGRTASADCAFNVGLVESALSIALT